MDQSQSPLTCSARGSVFQAASLRFPFHMMDENRKVPPFYLNLLPHVSDRFFFWLKENILTYELIKRN
jgi:hypothetical protein